MTTDTIRLGLTGVGKIARDQHIPSLLRANGIALVDVSPLRHVADAFMLGRRETVDAFD